MEEKLKDLRLDYGRDRLEISDLQTDPIIQFKDWFELALHTEGEIEPNAMVLSTVDADGLPSSRVVLLKDIIDGHLVFYTNYLSKKGSDIAETGHVSVVFWWRLLQRQVRVQGVAKKLDSKYADIYFNTRPVGSRIGAIVSPQSQVIASRDLLDEAVRREEEKVESGTMPKRPNHWGGYQIEPQSFEFWQGRSNRLHDRFRYDRKPGSWSIVRLAP